MQRSCDQCLWGLKCGEQKPCEDYTPMFEDDEDEQNAQEYFEELDERQDYYRQLVEEQQE